MSQHVVGLRSTANNTKSRAVGAAEVPPALRRWVKSGNGPSPAGTTEAPTQCRRARHRFSPTPLRAGAWLLLLLATTLLAAQDHTQHSAAYRSMEQKIAHLKQNAAREHPDPKPIEITQDEANAYFAEGGVKMPKGVSGLNLTATPGLLDGHAKVDFDVLTEKARSSNPLLAVFTGVHDIHVVAQASGSHGTGTITVQKVELDEIEIPQLLLQLFVDRYLKSKYPNVGLTSTFKLPLRIDSAAVENAKVALVQK